VNVSCLLTIGYRISCIISKTCCPAVWQCLKNGGSRDNLRWCIIYQSKFEQIPIIFKYLTATLGTSHTQVSRVFTGYLWMKRNRSYLHRALVKWQLSFLSDKCYVVLRFMLLQWITLHLFSANIQLETKQIAVIHHVQALQFLFTYKLKPKCAT